MEGRNGLEFQPSLHLLNRENWIICSGLYHAALSGDWKKANKILQKPPNGDRTATVNAAITSATKETVLHVAAGAKQSKFVQMLLREPGIDPTLRDNKGNTAFCSAVVAGAKNIVQIFFQSSVWRTDFLIHGSQNKTPLYLATRFGHGEIARELYRHGREANICIEEDERFGVFFNCIHNDIYELAITILEDEREDSRLAWIPDDVEKRRTALHYLSQKKPSVFSNDKNKGILSTITSRFLPKSKEEKPALKLVKSLWERILKYNNYNYAYVEAFINNSDFNFLTEAANQGNFDFLVAILSLYPEAIWAKDYHDAEHTIIHCSILKRHVKIFKIIHEIGIARSVIKSFEDDREGNNLLHFVANLPSQSRLNDFSGAALQMRQEMLWFQEVKKIVPPSLKSKRNAAGQTPKELFTEQHKVLEQLVKLLLS